MFAAIDSTHFLVAYEIAPTTWSACTDTPVYATILIVNPTAGTVSAGRANLLAGLHGGYWSGDGKTYVAGALAQLDATRFAFVHSNCSSPSSPSQGYAEVLTVDVAGDDVTAGTPLVFDASWAAFNAALKVDDTHILVAYQTGGNIGAAVVLTVSGSTLSSSGWQSFGATGQRHNLAPISSNRFLDTYAGTSNFGAARVITVSVSPVSLQIGAEQGFDSTATYSGGSLWAVDSLSFLVAYRANTSAPTVAHGRAALLSVSATTDSVASIATLADFPMVAVSNTSRNVVRAVPIGGTRYLATYTTPTVTDGQVIPLTVTVSSPGITAGSADNCNSAGCAQVAGAIDAVHLLGVSTSASQKLDACVLEVQCALP